ncbi:hypothetical protein [Ancylobacter sp. IITR112]|uniref:hypothetical protein n=1 Tax=Ancylobacter sp. IITR112 TaxID=3138073 RepID=UPI00352B3506
MGADGTLTGGGSATLTSLVLQDGATIRVVLGSVDANTLFAAGTLTMDGTLNIMPGLGYGVGVYRISSGTDALTDRRRHDAGR